MGKPSKSSTLESDMSLLWKKTTWYSLFIKIPTARASASSSVTYFQGQQCADTGRREYFYFVDHQGMLFLDDAKMKNFTSCYKEQHFLRFFFRRLRINELVVGKYSAAFPFISPCQGEINYVRAEEGGSPIVFTSLLDDDSPEPLLSFNHGGRFLSAPFVPSAVSMDPATGRVYHPAADKVGGVGLVADKLSILWTKEGRFEFDNGEDRPPTSFRWKGERIKLDNKIVPSG